MPTKRMVKQPVWATVRRDLGIKPLVEGSIGGESPVYVERWVYQARKVVVSAIACPVLVTQLGGARVREGEDGRWRSSTLPSQSILIPPGTATTWHYTGPVDDVAFYLLDAQSGVQKQLAGLAAVFGRPKQFADALVAALAQQLVDELHAGDLLDQPYLVRVSGLMLEQAVRALTGASANGIHPRHVHFARLQKVLRYINAHLDGALTNTTLASLAGVSESHFRRMFIEAVGVPPHHYVRNRRLAQARRLLASSDLPISVISEECGFCSQSHMTKCFREHHEVPPSTYRRQLKHRPWPSRGRNQARPAMARGSTSEL